MLIVDVAETDVRCVVLQKSEVRCTRDSGWEMEM